MPNSDFRKNLTLVTSYGRSVSDVCRRAGINRQQYNRYLSGQTTPSLSTLRRICDFFGLDDHEIFLDHKTFANIIRMRPPSLKKVEDSVTEFVRTISAQNQDQRDSLVKYEGYYHSYIQLYEDPKAVLRSLVFIRNNGSGWVSKSIERYSSSTFTVPSKLKYRGVVFLNADRLIILEQESAYHQSTWNTVMYATDFDGPKVLTGLSMGIAPESSHDIVCFRTAWVFLGRQPNVREAIMDCGLMKVDDQSIPDYIWRYIGETPLSGPSVLMPRY